MISDALFEPTRDRDRTGERVTARALRRSLLPLADPAAAADELAAIAGHRRRPILRALQRVERAETAKESLVIERARLLLAAALARTTDDGRAVAA